MKAEKDAMKSDGKAKKQEGAESQTKVHKGEDEDEEP